VPLSAPSLKKEPTAPIASGTVEFNRSEGTGPAVIKSRSSEDNRLKDHEQVNSRPFPQSFDDSKRSLNASNRTGGGLSGASRDNVGGYKTTADERMGGGAKRDNARKDGPSRRPLSPRGSTDRFRDSQPYRLGASPMRRNAASASYKPTAIVDHGRGRALRKSPTPPPSNQRVDPHIGTERSNGNNSSRGFQSGGPQNEVYRDQSFHSTESRVCSILPRLKTN